MYSKNNLCNRWRIGLNSRSRLLIVELSKLIFNGVCSYVTVGSILGFKIVLFLLLNLYFK